MIIGITKDDIANISNTIDRMLEGNVHNISSEDAAALSLAKHILNGAFFFGGIEINGKKVVF